MTHRRLVRDALLLLVLCLGLRSLSFVRPCLSDDEATYAVVAREMLAGRVLYRDVVDHKPPLIYVTYAATQVLGGPIGGMRILHLLTALVVFATAVLLAFIVRRFGAPCASPRAAFFAALLYIVFTTTLLPFDALAANCELYMLLPLIGSVALYLAGVGQARFRPALMAAAGALVGVAMFYKYQSAVHLVLYGLHAAWHHRRRPRRLLATWSALALGVASLLGAGVAVVVLSDSSHAGWFWFRFNFAYIRHGMSAADILARAVPRLSFAIVPALLLWALGIGAALRALLDAERPTAPELGFAPFCAGWLLLSGFAISTGGRFFGHYFHQVTAPLAVLAAPRAAELWGSRRRLVLTAVALPAAAFFFVGIGYERLLSAVGRPEPDYAAMVAFLDAHAPKDAGLFVWGNVPVLYFEAQRPLGSRFVFANYLTGLSPATSTQSDPNVDASANIVTESWDMLEADLAQRRPPLVVDSSPGDVGHYGKFPPERFPRLQKILLRDYRLIGNVEGVRVLERREEAR